MKNIIVEKRNRIGIVTVNRPNELNSMNSETRKELANAFEELDLDYKKHIKIIGKINIKWIIKISIKWNIVGYHNSDDIFPLLFKGTSCAILLYVIHNLGRVTNPQYNFLHLL